MHTFLRTVEPPQTFDDEAQQPFLGNLSTHLRKKHPNRGDPPSDLPSQPGDSRGISVATAKIMEEFLKDGDLNPRMVRSQKNFYRVFAAWIIQDDLPFTTGEMPGIARLFKFMESQWKLPTDTTVRNYLAKIFSDMHKLVKKELKVREYLGDNFNSNSLPT